MLDPLQLVRFFKNPVLCRALRLNEKDGTSLEKAGVLVVTPDQATHEIDADVLLSRHRSGESNTSQEMSHEKLSAITKTKGS
jgi:hypothetical protein